MKIHFYFTNGHDEIYEADSFDAIVQRLIADYNVGIDDPKYLVHNIDDIIAAGVAFETTN